MKKLILHVILNSHLDPIWQWGYANGLDEVCATAHSACNLLDDYPEIHVTRGEAWFYEMLEKHDPGTFARVVKHIKDGRWHVVGGWYIQPDCNLAAPETYAMHAKISADYFRKKFGIKGIQTGYNVDSFGHGAYLPEFYAKAGMKNYCFLRPGPHEKKLPGEVFRWRSPSGYELLAGRITAAYTCNVTNILERVREVIDTADRKLGHATLYVGMGDHGAGPTRSEIELLKAHWNDWKKENVELRFSHPDAFFDAIRKAVPMESLPVVEGELQFHAIGCYSAISRMKREMRQTEDALIQFGHLLTPAVRVECWKKVLFATFHDVLAGSCVESAMGYIYDSLAYVRHVVETKRLEVSRKTNPMTPPDKCQRVLIDNYTKSDYDGFCEYEPWLGIQGVFQRHDLRDLRLRDEEGLVVPMQIIPPDCLASLQPMRMLFPIDVMANERRTLYLDFGNDHTKVQGNPAAKMPALKSIGSPRIAVIPDSTDTWSHIVSSYPTDGAVEVSEMDGKPTLLFDGPIASEWRYILKDKKNTQRFDVVLRKYHASGDIRLRIANLTMVPPRSIVKLLLTPPFTPATRQDGVSGGIIARAMDGREYPLRNTMRLADKTGKKAFGVASQECTSCDVQPDGTIRLTLLRTPYYCHHIPVEVRDTQAHHATDQQLTEWNILIVAGKKNAQDLEKHMAAYTQPLDISEVTTGVWRDEANA